MTIKDDSKQTPQSEEPDIAVNLEPDVPFVSATPVDQVLPQAPPEVMATPVKPSDLNIQAATPASMDTAPQVQVVAPPPITTTVTTTPVPGGGPPNAPPGGRWAQVKRVGPATWTTCSIVSAITCLCCCIPCGLFAFLCPCDQETAYVSPDGRVYSRNGEFLGNSKNMNVRYS